jgi:peptidyl-prolyl cis-trans isomerase D
MQIIQTIRDKGAAIVIGVIALSLIGFLLMDANQGSTGFFNSLSSHVGKVNGTSIEKTDFEKKYNTAYNAAKQQESQTGQPADAQQIREQVWNQMVAENVFYAEADKLGIDFTSKELSAILNSNDQTNPLLQDQSMLDPATGRLDPSKVTTAIAQIKKAKGDQLEAITAQIAEPQRLGSVSGKYFALLNASAYYPSWMQAKDSIETKNFATISYAYIPYGEINDSLATVKVTDGEIDAYTAAHKKQYKQEAGRMISYITFSQFPSSADSAATKQLATDLKQSFSTETNNQAFVARNASIIPYDSNYLPKSQIQSSAIDTILKQPVGTVIGPYVDNGSYVLAKYLGSKNWSDSLRASHILLPVDDPKTGQSIMPDSTASRIADSILTAIKGGANFANLARQYGTDATRDKGGDLGYFGYSAPMVEEFNRALFGEPVGTKTVIRTRFGYHVIEITGGKGTLPVYRVAFLAKEILPTEATISTANLNATKLSGQKGGKDFETYIAKNGLQKISWPTPVKENDFRLGQLNDARSLIRWAFDAKKGDVSEVFNMNDQFVVATLEKILSEGTQDAASARQTTEGIIRNKKKADIIIKKLGTAPTVEAAAAAYNKQVQVAGADSSITFGTQIIPNVGPEPKVIGAAFNVANQSKPSAPIAGETGVFVIKVTAINTKPAATPEVAAQQKSQKAAAIKTQVAAGWFEGLKNQATIDDNRRKYY